MNLCISFAALKISVLLRNKKFSATNITAMFKKGVSYLLLCCLLNMLTTLPGRCCVHDDFKHGTNSIAKTHSQTLLAFIVEEMLDKHESESDSDDSDCFCTIYNEAQGTNTQVTATTKQFLSAGQTAIIFATVSISDDLGYFGRKFSLPPHYNYLFRLTPF